MAVRCKKMQYFDDAVVVEIESYNGVASMLRLMEETTEQDCMKTTQRNDKAANKTKAAGGRDACSLDAKLSKYGLQDKTVSA